MKSGALNFAVLGDARSRQGAAIARRSRSASRHAPLRRDNVTSAAGVVTVAHVATMRLVFPSRETEGSVIARPPAAAHRG
jgi:hypothetical protein